MLVRFIWGSLWAGRREKGELTQGGVNQDTVEELLRVGGQTKGGHGLEQAEGVALVNELVGITLVEGAGNEQNDVIDHVAVGDVVQEGGQGLDSVGPEVLELFHHLLCALFSNGCRGQRGRLVLEEVAIVSAGKMQLEVCKRKRKKRNEKSLSRGKVTDWRVPSRFSH